MKQYILIFVLALALAVGSFSAGFVSHDFIVDAVEKSSAQQLPRCEDVSAESHKCLTYDGVVYAKIVHAPKNAVDFDALYKVSRLLNTPYVVTEDISSPIETYIIVAVPAESANEFLSGYLNAAKIVTP